LKEKKMVTLILGCGRVLVTDHEGTDAENTKAHHWTRSELPEPSSNPTIYFL
jgi:hypothetical protein